jgi:acetate kinase
MADMAEWHMNVLVLNCGSSSLKFQVIETDIEKMHQDADELLARGAIENIGSQCLIKLDSTHGRAERTAKPLRSHREAIDYVLRWLISPNAGVDGIRGLGDIHAVGHRVVHGGEKFSQSVIIDPEVLKGIEDCIELASLHNPANLSGVTAVTELLGTAVPQVAVFDTAFHADMPATSYLYALPYQYYRRHKIRRYGFHGTSHRYVAYRFRKMKSITKEQVRIITLHLGNGCSACAISEGKSVMTSMGMTPLEGLVMGTRCGDVDPALLEHISRKEGMDFVELNGMMNKQSGLLGISGLTNDMRELLEEELECGDRRASLAIDLFCQRVKKYIGAYLGILGGADAVIFTGGIGENSPQVRARILSGLDDVFGMPLDEAKNAKACGGYEGAITADGARLEAIVIPTNEELLIARDTIRCIGGK